MNKNLVKCIGGRLQPKLLIAVIIVLATVGGMAPQRAGADKFDQQINTLAQQNDQTAATIAQLTQQASSYQNAIDRLQSQIDQMQSQINDNQAKQADLQSKILAGQLELERQRALLGQHLRVMYVDGQISTIEMLASSKNLSDFIDKKEYRTIIAKKVQESLVRIKALQSQLKLQQTQTTQLIADQVSQQALLNAGRAEQDKLLSYNVAQRTDYGSQVKNNLAKISDLRRQQASLIARYQIGNTSVGDPNHGGYPVAWNNAAQDSILDSWGMFNRECVSYTAFKVHQDYLAGKNGRDMPYWGGIGDAKQWPTNARAAGILVDSNPTPGSIAISTAGTWGHSMYVESVGTKDGQEAIYVSQYNTDFNGHYSEGWRYTTGLVFIHF